MKLSDLMEFDHVIEVHSDGTVTDGPSWLYAPNLHDERLDSPSWSLMNGYSGQYLYSGPIMNNAEFIGGKMAEAILATPGYYVAIVASWEPEDGTTEALIEGWAVARYCSHTWVAGMMYVHPEDLGTVMAARRTNGDSPVECEQCEAQPVKGRDY